MLVYLKVILTVMKNGGFFNVNLPSAPILVCTTQVLDSTVTGLTCLLRLQNPSNNNNVIRFLWSRGRK
jgi:hypothetical protein